MYIWEIIYTCLHACVFDCVAFGIVANYACSIKCSSNNDVVAVFVRAVTARTCGP